MAPPSLSSPVRRGPRTNRGEGRSLGATFGTESVADDQLRACNSPESGLLTRERMIDLDLHEDSQQLETDGLADNDDPVVRVR